ncbi:MAG: DUF4123 domain-containing protein [Bacteroidales bacterium]
MAKITLTRLPKETKPTAQNKIVAVTESGKTTPAEFLLESTKKGDYKLYGIIDSARNEEVFRYLITGNVEYKSLFEGTLDVQSFGVSGFLVECIKESPLFTWMTSEAWGENCCIFFTSKSNFEDLFTHFQQFNRVYLEDEKVVLFRYYDPRVLRTYLPSCSLNEIDLFFGDVQAFYAESEDPTIIHEFKKVTSIGKEILSISGHKIKIEDSSTT